MPTGGKGGKGGNASPAALGQEEEFKNWAKGERKKKRIRCSLIHRLLLRANKNMKGRF